MKKILKSILIIAVVVLMNAHVYATTGKVTYDTVRIRKEANTDSEILTVASLNEKVEIIEKEGDWYKVKYSEFTGYIRNDMLEVEEDTEKSENTENTETSENKEEVKYLTDAYTEISFQEFSNNGISQKESLGIDSIEINFDSHFFQI